MASRQKLRRVLSKSTLTQKSPFEYGLVQGGFKSPSYIKVMDWIAQKAAALFEQTGKLTVIVQDNSPIHKSQEVRACWQRWSEQGLLLSTGQKLKK